MARPDLYIEGLRRIFVCVAKATKICKESGKRWPEAKPWHEENMKNSTTASLTFPNSFSAHLSAQPFLSEPYLCPLKYFSACIGLGHPAITKSAFLPQLQDFDESTNFSSKLCVHHLSAVSGPQRFPSILLKRMLLHLLHLYEMPCSAFARLVLVSTSRTCRMKLLFAEKCVCVCIPSDRRMRFNAMILVAWMLRYLRQNCVRIIHIYVHDIT